MNEQEYIDMFTIQEEGDSEEYEYFLEEICSEIIQIQILIL